MKKIKFLALCAVAAGVVTSCQKDEIADSTTPDVSSIELSKSQIEALEKAGVNPLGAELVTVQHFNESPYQAIATGNMNGTKDLVLNLEELMNGTYALEGDGIEKQYRTNSLVSRSKGTISVIGYTGSCCALTSRMRTGLQWAVDNYNALGLTFRMTLSFSASTNADMVVYNAGGSGAGGQAEFPSGGNPGKYIQIFGGMANYNNNVNEHVIGHEMGHAVGFRHTDYARRRCDGSNEGTAGSIGAVHIPGTPTANQWGQSGLDSGSLMISCFDGSEDGEFSNADRTALQYLY